MILAAISVPQTRADPEEQLEAAIHRELVTGDLKGAYDQYRRILSQPGSSRSAAARALFHMGQCLEKLGQRREARAAYARVAKEFSDQAQVAAGARSKLSGWTDAPPGPRNLAFEEGNAGDAPPGWSTNNGVAERTRKGCRSAACAAVRGSVGQSFSAAAYRGKTVRLRALLRVEAPAERAQMWLRIERGRTQPVFFDDMSDRPVRSAQWTAAEIMSDVAEDSQSIDFGVSSGAKGRVWVDEVAFEIVPRGEVESARDSVRILYGLLDAAFEQGVADDVVTAAIRDARYRARGENQPFRIAWSVEGQPEFNSIRTTVTSFRMSGTGAVATVRSDWRRPSAYGDLSGVNTFRDAWARAAGVWTLKDRALLTGHFVSTPTDSGTAKLVAADLKRLASPLATPEAGHTLYDLAPFGAAIGDARVVAIGEATEGTREQFQMKHRLLEYLVKEKGFTAVAIAGDGDNVDALDRYIRGGGGDPKPLLARIAGWHTQEALDLIEWMRGYNQSQGGLSILPIDSAPAERRIVLWTGNDAAALSVPQAGRQTMGMRLRAALGSRLYVVGFALHRGELRATAKTGKLAAQTIPPLPDGTGDWVFGAAGMPLFFLDLHGVPPMTTLGLWLAEPHLFLFAGAHFNRDDPESHLLPEILSRTYDAVVFVKEGHAVKELEASRASNQ